MTDLLSQDEVDALLDVVEEGAIEVSDTKSKLSDGAEAYDLSCNSSRLSSWSKQLGLLDDKLVKRLGASLLGLLHKATTVKMEGTRLLRFGEYLDGLEIPTGLNTYRLEPAGGALMIALDAHLVYSLVESFFGGGGRQMEINGKGFTRTEQRVIEIGLKTLLQSIKTAWKQLDNQQLTLCESEHNPQASTAFPAADVVMVRRYSVTYKGGGGELHLIMSSNLIETLFQEGGTPRQPENGHAKATMRRRAPDFKANVTGELCGARLSLNQLLNLSRGDIIPVDSPEIVDVKVNGIKKFSARVGEVDGRVGLSITESEEAARR